MTVKYLVLTEEIRKELQALAEVSAQIATGLADHDKADDDNKGYIVDSLALSLQSFYTGCENIFRRIFDIAVEPVITLASMVSNFFPQFKAQLEHFCLFLSQVGNGA